MRQHLSSVIKVVALIAAPWFTLGCEDDREILDVDTPGGGVEIEQDRDTGEVDVDVDTNN